MYENKVGGSIYHIPTVYILAGKKGKSPSDQIYFNFRNEFCIIYRLLITGSENYRHKDFDRLNKSALYLIKFKESVYYR